MKDNIQDGLTRGQEQIFKGYVTINLGGAVAYSLVQSGFKPWPGHCVGVQGWRPGWDTELGVLGCHPGRDTASECRDGVVVKALASHQCGPGSISGPGVISGLSLLLVLFLALRVFLRALRLSSLHNNQHSKFQFDLEAVDKINSHLVDVPTANSYFIYLFIY